MFDLRCLGACGTDSHFFLRQLLAAKGKAPASPSCPHMSCMTSATAFTNPGYEEWQASQTPSLIDLLMLAQT